MYNEKTRFGGSFRLLQFPDRVSLCMLFFAALRGIRYPQYRCVELGGAARPTRAQEASPVQGTGGKRVPSGHLHEVQSDPQVGSETSRGHG